MVYKKYVNKRGKIFGPYYYESYREGVHVRKRYIGGEKEYQQWLRKRVSREKRKIWISNFGNKIRVVEQPIISSNFVKIVFFAFILLAVLVGFLALINNFNGRFTGFAINENMSQLEIQNQLEKIENVVEEFNASNADLAIKEPISSGLFGEPITKNKNSRMDFDLNGKNLRLYFDLLNYSGFVDGVASSLSVDNEEIAETNVVSFIQKREKGAGELENASEQVVDETNSSNVMQNNKSEQEAREETNISNVMQENKTENVNNVTQGNKTEDIINVNPISNESNQQVIGEENQTEQNTGQVIGITGFFVRFFGLIGRVVGIDMLTSENDTISINPAVNESNQSAQLSQDNQTSQASNIVNLDNNDIKRTLENLTDEKVEEIADNSIVEAESFSIQVNDSKINNEKPEYKWGYKVKLNDLKFMAKIDVTSDEVISIYNENTLKIGRNLLSFKDLADAGYKVRIETPALEIPIGNLTLKIPALRNITIINETIEKIINETDIASSNFSEFENATFAGNASDIIEPPVNETILIINETIPVVNETEENQTQFINVTEPIVNETKEEKQEEKETKAEEKKGSETPEIAQTPATDETTSNSEQQIDDKEKTDEKEGVKSEEKKEEKQEQKEEKKTEQPTEQTPAEIPVLESNPITGGIIRFFRFTGKIIIGTGKVIAGTGKAIVGLVIGSDENATFVEDMKYSNIIIIYIEREFVSSVSNKTENSEFASPSYEDLDSDGKISIGDIIELDPTLIIIPISDAEELDSNRSYIRNIYNETFSKDDNYVFINNSHFVRATFKQALGKNNDITVFARLNRWNNSVVINGQEVAYDIYQKKKRIDEIRRLLNQT